MLLEDYRDDNAREFAQIVLEMLDLVIDPANGWIIDMSNDTYMQINGRTLTESVTQGLMDYGFVAGSTRLGKRNINSIISNIDVLANVVFGNDPISIPPEVEFGGNFRYVYQSTDMLFDPLNNITLVNYLFAYIVNELYGPEWMTGFCTTAVPGMPKTIIRVLLSDGRYIDSNPRYNDCIKLIELLGHIISDDGGPMPDLSRFDMEPVKKNKKTSTRKRR